jgi:hypothetical protein
MSGVPSDQACIFVIALGPGPREEGYSPFLNRLDPLDVPLAADRTWVLVVPDTDRRRGDQVRPLAAFRDMRVRLLPLSVKGFL